MRKVYLFSLLPLFLTGCATGNASRIVTLGGSLEHLRAHFNAQRGKPRVIGLFSPT